MTEIKAIYDNHIDNLVKSLPMDDTHFITKLSSKQLLPGDTESKIKSFSTQSEKASYLLSHVIKPALDIDDDSDFINLLSIMEQCGYNHVVKLSGKITREIDKLKSAKASKSKEAKEKKSDDAKLSTTAGVKRSASISAKASESKETKGKISDDAKQPSKAGVKRAASISAKGSESKETKGKKSDDATLAKSSESPDIKRKKPSDKAIENITTNYAKLTRSFPTGGLLPELYSKEVITYEQKEDIQKEKLKKDKVSILFDGVIRPDLEIGITTKYDKLIEVMEASDDTTANHLAILLKGTES